MVWKQYYLRHNIKLRQLQYSPKDVFSFSSTFSLMCRATVGTGLLRSLWGRKHSLQAEQQQVFLPTELLRAVYRALWKLSSLATQKWQLRCKVTRFTGATLAWKAPWRSESLSLQLCGPLPGFSQSACHTPLRETQSCVSSSGICNSLLILPKSDVVYQSEIIFSVSMLPSSAFGILVFWAVGEKSCKVNQESNSHAEQERILLIFNPQ